MVNEVFTPLISGGFLTFFMWIFILAALGSFLWFVSYINNSKIRTPKTTLSAFTMATVTMMIALLFISVRYGWIV